MAQNYPSVKAIYQAFSQWITLDQAREIRSIMEGPRLVETQEPRGQWGIPETVSRTRLQRIDLVLGTHGVERVPRGRNAKSPAFVYCNTGDTYATTILKVKGRFRIGCWGDIVERGSYD